MSTFDDALFPTAIALGATGGPERRTQIVSLASGHEERNQLWAHSRRRYDAGYGVRSLDDIHAVIAFFEERRGRLRAFRWRDPFDHKSCDPSAQPAATDLNQSVTDSIATFQLTKTYGSGESAYARTITTPVVGTVQIAVDGTPLTEGVDYVVNHSTGLVTKQSGTWSAATTVTAGFIFDVPARFDTDRLDVDLSAFAAGAIPSIPVVEVRL